MSSPEKSSMFCGVLALCCNILECSFDVPERQSWLFATEKSTNLRLPMSISLICSSMLEIMEVDVCESAISCELSSLLFE